MSRNGRSTWALLGLLALTTPTWTWGDRAPSAAPAVLNESASAEVERRIGADVRVLASDQLEGRGLTTKGIEQAADYIRQQFRDAGLKSGMNDGSYFQPFDVNLDSKVNSTKSRLVLRSPTGETITLAIDKDFRPLAFGGPGSFNGPIVFAGYGISAPEHHYDDYASLDVTGKVVLIIRREPQQGNEKSVFDGKENSKHAPFAAKIDHAWTRKAAGLLIVNDVFTASKPADDVLVPAAYGDAGAVGLPFAQITQPIADKLLASTPLKSLREVELAIDADLKPRSLPLTGWTAEGTMAFERSVAHAKNVVGVIEGKGAHANETIVIGAHYDHLGFGERGTLAGKSKEIHNGADDNASGTAALIELARQFGRRGSAPDRRLVFIAFSGEERGLLGSRHYVKKDPLFPLKDTVAMINFDMVGRLKENRLIVYGVKTATAFEPLIDRLNQKHRFQLKKTGTGSGPSDHASFNAVEIPTFHFFTGQHGDYHRPSDDSDKINVAGLRQVVAFSGEVIDAIASAPDRPAFVKTPNDDPHAGMDLPKTSNMAYLGTRPDYGEEVDGVLLDDVNEGSPAAKGGLKKGDIIVEMGGAPIKGVRALSMFLYKHKPGETVNVVVLRGKEKVTLPVVLGKKNN